ncbi:MAG TPA: ester cyclase [Chloroflexota bacterium]|nr:ester cyclase [Chloroflexota bacterium]
MSREAMLAVIDRMIAAGNRQDVDAWAGVYSLDATNHGHAAGRAGLRAIFEDLVRTFPDWRYELGRVVVEGDVVMAEITMTGTHLGTSQLPVLGGLLVGVPPTGRRVRVSHAHSYRIVDGYIVEHHAVRDDLGMLQQLGLVPTTTHPAGDISRPALGA